MDEAIDNRFMLQGRFWNGHGLNLGNRCSRNQGQGRQGTREPCFKMSYHNPRTLNEGLPSNQGWAIQPKTGWELIVKEVLFL